MSEIEMEARLISSCSGFPINKIMNMKKRMSKKEQKIAWDKYTKWLKSVKGYYTLMKPQNTRDIIPVLNTALYEKNPDIIMIDYAGLLDEANDADQEWSELLAISKKCKNFSMRTKIPIVFVMQLNDKDDQLRQSTGVKFFGDMVWWWRAKDKEKETGIVTIIQAKCRQGSGLPFKLKFNWETSEICDLSQDMFNRNSQEPKKSKKKKKKKDRK